MSAAPSKPSAWPSPTARRKQPDDAAAVAHAIVENPLPADAFAPVTKYKRQPWTEAELAILRERYPHEPTAQIAADLGRNVGKVYAQATKLGLAKTPEFLRSGMAGGFRPGSKTGESYRYPKGHVPANKGTRRPGWAPGRMAETQFKKGDMNGAARSKWKPVGTIMPDTEGYLRIKLRERVPGAGEHGWNSKGWKLYHHQVWEAANGPIPPKHIVRFRDGNRSNCAIDNLELISMAENARRNQMFRSLPRELAEVIQLAGALKRKIRRRTEKENNDGKEQNERSE